jgi:hypothetical protein
MDSLRDIAPYWPVVAGLIAAAFTVFKLTQEIRWSRSTRHIDLMLKFQERFHANGMILKRNRAAAFLLSQRASAPVHDPAWSQVDDVVDFFQVVGTLVKRGHANQDLAYNFFHYWFSHYWLSVRAYVEYVRAKSPVTWAEAQWLYDKLRAYELKHNRGKRTNLTDADFDRFFAQESSSVAQPALAADAPPAARR